MDRPLLPEMEPYANRNLFSDHFLRELLPDDESWAVDEDKVRLATQAALNLYAPRKEELPHLNEAQLEQEFVRPMLESLGHVFQVQPSLPTPEGVRRPDYAFFATREDKRQAGKHKGKLDYFKKAIAIGDAKQWGRPLDKRQRGGTDKFDVLSPSWQIDYYLRTSEVPWAILTDGRFWRLYNRETSFRLDVYYEIDLPQLLAARDIEAFNYFYLFFRREAFLPLEERECFLDRVYKGSLEYAKAVGEDLKENVYSALRLLAQGFVDYPDNHLDPERDLVEIHQNALICLYRLLFICYAEDRLLLPRKNPIYRGSYGLVSMERELADKIDGGEHLSSVHTTCWGRLLDLFRLINEGSERLGIDKDTMEVPPYNGGLFDPEKHPFLEKTRVADHYLVPVIDLLSRSESRNGSGKAFVDYSSIDVRHLGSIYEGLLEYKLRVAEEPMVASKSRGRENWVQAKKEKGKKVVDRVEAGELYLVTDRGERKATGSFYTPDCIVKYIVEHTLGPLIEEKMREQDSIEGILSLKVLDPAMGSGHFLVEATDRLAHALVQALGRSEEEPEEDVRWARREVVERCIYGVDLNPLAVELAKLSLWLHTVAEGKPLNFLDHHLKVGNSLIGARVENLGSLPGTRKRAKSFEGEEVIARQMNLFEQRLSEKMHTMLRELREITETPTDELVDTERKKAADEEMQELKAPFKAVADLWVSTYFGNEMRPDEYDEALEHIGERKKLLALPAVQRTGEIAEEHRFFHWELEFPEVFYDRDGRPLYDAAGFDAAVGNPPYVSFGLGRTGKLPSFEETFYRAAFKRSAEYKISVYALFIEQGLARCRSGGYESLIVPDSFLNGMYFSKIREYLLRESVLQHIVVFDRDFWESGDVGFPTIFVARKRTEEQSLDAGDPHFLHARVSEPEDLFSNHIAYTRQSQRAQLSNPRMRFRLLSKASETIVRKMKETGLPLTGLLSMHHGIRSKIGRSEIIAKKQLGPEWKKAIVSSREIHRHSITPEDHFIRVDPDILFSGGWDPDHIEDDKILIRRTGDSLICVVDVNGYYHTNALIYGVPTIRGGEWSLFALSSILNSKLMNFYYQRTTMKTGRTLPQVEIDTLKDLPIRRIEFTTRHEERAQLVEQAQFVCTSGNLGGLLTATDAWLTADPEQADVIHDLLRHLAQQMMAMNEEKQTEVRGFLDWLAGYTGLPIEDWRLKTRIKAYWEHGWDEIRRALRQNRKAIEQASGQNVEGREALEAIQSEFDQSLARLKPLLERIASTDRLIDLIVYRLYGLTEEDVAIVEGE